MSHPVLERNARPCFIEINSSNLLSENINDLLEMQSVRQ